MVKAEDAGNEEEGNDEDGRADGATVETERRLGVLIG